jgi:hypothetical protein
MESIRPFQFKGIGKKKIRLHLTLQGSKNTKKGITALRHDGIKAQAYWFKG